MQHCLFCGGDADEPDHRLRCDGRQGEIEAAIPDAEPARLTHPGLVHRDDPFTSVQAAAALDPHISELQGRVLDAFRAHGSLTDQQLETLPEFAGYAYSTVRKRRTELYQRGAIVPIGHAINTRGRTMLLFALSPGGHP